MPKSTGTLEEVIIGSRGALLDFIGIDEPTKEDFQRARTIQGIYGSATRELQTRGAQEAARYAMATDFLTPDERVEYVRLAMPDHEAVKVHQARKELASA